jgi:hypothetical protein
VRSFGSASGLISEFTALSGLTGSEKYTPADQLALPAHGRWPQLAALLLAAWQGHLERRPAGWRVITETNSYQKALISY